MLCRLVVRDGPVSDVEIIEAPRVNVVVHREDETVYVTFSDFVVDREVPFSALEELEVLYEGTQVMHLSRDDLSPDPVEELRERVDRLERPELPLGPPVYTKVHYVEPTLVTIDDPFRNKAWG